mmetsp:Transcript_7164/g.12906  ORF Transcript_7164/g.12906 Transcript_7164/m.12906 type:complete len:93 (-) Transcript_7164:1062-1340(-)
MRLIRLRNGKEFMVWTVFVLHYLVEERVMSIQSQYAFTFCMYCGAHADFVLKSCHLKMKHSCSRHRTKHSSMFYYKSKSSRKATSHSHAEFY